MTQLGDVQIGSAEYMVEPASYRRMSDGTPEGRPGRWTMSDFIGGQLRNLQLEREAAFAGESVGPVMGGQGIEPWPYRTTWTDSVMRTVNNNGRRVLSCLCGGKVFLAYERYIYETVATGAGAWANVTQRADLGAGLIATDLIDYYGSLYIACGNSGDMRSMNTGTYALTTLTGTRARYMEPYAGKFMLSNPTSGVEQQLQMSTAGGLDTRELDSEILGMCLHNSSVAVATRNGIYLMGGKPDPVNAGKWLGEPTPIFTSGSYSSGNDYTFLSSYGGRLYTWLFGQVMEWQPNAGSNRQGWRSTGLAGRFCYGGAVIGGLLIVSIISHQGAFEVWAWDGAAWWCLDRTTVNARLWPVDVFGAGTMDLAIFRDGDAGVTYQLMRLKPRDLTKPALNSDGNYVTPLIDAGERDKQKAWRTIAAYFAAPEIRHNPISTDAIDIYLDYSIDAGKTWTQAATINTNDPTVRDRTLTADLGNAQKVSRYLQLRVRWASITDWSPTLVGLMAEYELLDQPSRRRRWSLRVRPRDETVRRDEAVDPRTGQQIAADLWTAWANGSTVPFRDVDYDLAPTAYQVRIVGIDEKREGVADAGVWTDSSIQLTIVEI